jgi:hypothetical protein
MNGSRFRQVQCPRYFCQKPLFQSTPALALAWPDVFVRAGNGFQNAAGQVNEAKVTYKQGALEMLGEPTAEGDIEWVSAAILVFVALVFADAIMRSVNSMALNAEFQMNPRLTERNSSTALEQIFGLQQPDTGLDISQQRRRELERLLWHRERMEIRNDLYCFMLVTWGLFEYSTSAFMRTPDLPLQP